MVSLPNSDEKEYLSLAPFLITDLLEIDFKGYLAPYLSDARKITVKKKHIFFHEGEVTDKIFFVTKGITYESMINENGLEQKFLAFSDYPLCLASTCHKQPVLFTFAALTDVVAYEFTFDDFLSLMQKNKDFLTSVLKFLAIDTRRTSSVLDQHHSSSTLQKVCQILYCYHIGKKYYTQLNELRLSQSLLASLAGVHRVSVANSLKELKEKNISV